MAVFSVFLDSSSAASPAVASTACVVASSAVAPSVVDIDKIRRCCSLLVSHF